MTGSYDPDLNLTYWGTGNPGPDWNPGQRPGDNLYSDCVLALDPDTGKLKWYFQFTPNDAYDYDSVQVPVLADMDWNGSPRKLMLWANRNGFYYVLDRTTGKFLTGGPFAKVNWASGLDAKGRPIPTPQPAGKPTFPGIQGATNWYSPSFSPRTGLFYIPTWEGYSTVFTGVDVDYREGLRYTGGANASPIAGADNPGGTRQGPVNTYTEALAHGAVIALDPHTGKKKWSFEMHDVNTSGILTTASDLLFSGGREGYLPGARCAHRRAAMEGESRRRNRRRADQLPGGRQAVRFHRLGERPVCLRYSRYLELTTSLQLTIFLLSVIFSSRYSRTARSLVLAIIAADEERPGGKMKSARVHC